MPLHFLPEFIADLQSHADANFAKRVLLKTVDQHGNFKEDADDHRYKGIADAWIRYVSRGNSAYRVIFIRSGENIFLYRAGEHSIENNLAAPHTNSIEVAVAVKDPSGVIEMVAAVESNAAGTPQPPPKNRLMRNSPSPEINRAIFSRRNLPHRDIWLVAPFINSDLLEPTAQLGKLLFDQVEDGASVTIITAPPAKEQDIDWLEKLDERRVGVYFYPRLHSKLYCFVLDENRMDERGLPERSKLSSLLLVGSSNLTAAGLALNQSRWNEELCYSIPHNEIGHVETYVTELMLRGYDLKEVRTFRARGQWQRLENYKWS